MAAEKQVIKNVDATLIDKVDFHDARATAAFFRRIGDTMSTGQVWANIATGYFRMGTAAKAVGDNAPPDVAPAFAAYRAAAEKRKGKPLTDATAETYRSVAKTLAEIGYTLPYDGATLIDYIAEKGGSFAYGTRAKVFREIADNFQKEPTAEEIAEFAKRYKTAGDNVTDAALAVQKTITSWMEGDPAPFADVISENDGLFEASEILREAMEAYVKAAADVVPATPAKTRNAKMSPAAAKLAAKRAERNAPTTH
jgi:hypothetical protein